MSTHIVAILQARLGSSRLPAKVLVDIAGQPMLAHIVQRVEAAHTIDQCVLATTQLPQDDALEQWAYERGIACFRGAEVDCLDRYYHAARQFAADIVVRLTGDNPLIDGSFLDWMIEQYSAVSPACDYMVASSAGGFPVGLSGEMFSFAALERAWHKDTNPAWREHVTPYIYRHPELFRLHALTNPVDLSHMRWTVDTPEDLAFVRQIYNHFGSNTFSWQDVLALLEQHPEWLEINRHIEQKKV